MKSVTTATIVTTDKDKSALTPDGEAGQGERLIERKHAFDINKKT